MRTNTLFLTCIIMLFFSINSAFGINLRVERRDMKLATQVLVELQTMSTPIVGDASALKNDQATSSGAITTVTSFLIQPDVCRTITITSGGVTADVPADDVVVNGTNAIGVVISESITFAANEAATKTGSKAFCTVSSIVFPIQDGAGATYDIGQSDKLGLKRCMDNSGKISWTSFDGVFEGTRPTITFDVDEVEKNTVDINGTLDGSKDVEVYFIQNFRCLP